MNKCYELVRKFLNKYPLTVAFRVSKHCKVINNHLNSDEEIIYAFAAQKTHNPLYMFNTNVIALTNKRIMVATKRVLWGYFFVSITPDMFNDLSIYKGIIWGRITIDTVNEEVVLSNISPKALSEINLIITEYMMKEKQKYGQTMRKKN